MAFNNATLSLIGHGRDNKLFIHDASSDTMATVATAGYFNNKDDDIRLAVDDLVMSLCGDGDFLQRVSAVDSSTGSVTTQPTSMNGPWRGVIGSASGSITVPGISELGTGTASAHVLSAAPYPGARVTIVQCGSATTGISVATNATTVTINGQGDRTITFDGEGQNVTLLGVSTTRWAIIGGDLAESGFS